MGARSLVAWYNPFTTIALAVWLKKSEDFLTLFIVSFSNPISVKHGRNLNGNGIDA
jgi:hypothetical protein